MDEIFAIATVVLAGIVVFELSTGKLLGRYFGIRTTRAERPVRYWIYLARQCLLLVLGTLYTINVYCRRQR